MSSTKSATDTKESKQTSPGRDAEPKTTRSNSTGGHEVTGAEKFFETGGSGGVPAHTGHGYEHLAQH